VIHRLTTLLCCAAVAAAVLPSAAHAGQYTVTSCFGDGVNNSWQPFHGNGHVDAYSDCPGGVSVNGRQTAGMVARNTYGSAAAPGLTMAEVFFDAPAGGRIVRVTGEINQTSTNGWQAGIHDDGAGQWRWCGTSCLSTFGGWYGFDIGGLSTNRVSAYVICGRQSCARDGLYGLAALRNVSVVVSEDSPPSVAIASGPLASGGWQRGVQEVGVAASDGVGIRRTTVLVDGVPRRGAERGCNPTRTVPCPNGTDSFPIPTTELSDGPHTLTAEAVDSAGNEAQTTRRIAVDNTAPLSPSALAVAGATGWRGKNSFQLRWSNPRQSAAPIAAASIVLCPLAHTTSDLIGCVTPSRTSAGLQSATGVRVPGPGQWRARVWLRDAAGNQSSSNSAETILRFDDQAPTVAFLASSPERPTVIQVKAQDVGSGLATREILLRRRGGSTWMSLPVVADRSGFSAVIDDEHLPDGLYELRARVVDLAGNEHSTDRRTDGQIAALALPLRIKTSLRVGKRKRVRARGAKGKRRYRIVLIEKPQSRYGHTILLRGRLTSPGGNPLAGRDLEVLEQTHLPAAPWRPIATLHTSKTGRFTFRALRGPSRTLRFRFDGTPTIRGRTAEVRLGVRAATTMTVSRHRVVNGEGVTFRGRLRGRPVPASGKLIELQARARGRWLTFGTTHAHAGTGRWSFPYRFSATRGNVHYRFRVRVPKEAGYPYEMGTSRSVEVSVRGL
jgi:hypothetical protein